MFPYVEHPTFQLGPISFGAFHALVALALVVEFQIVMWRAPSHGIPRRTASSLTGWAILWGLVGGHVFDLVAYYPEELVRNPLELLRVWGGMSSFGGMLGGLSALAVVMRRHALTRADMWRFVDCLLFALPFTLAVGRAGCALQHDHMGIASDHWLTVRFPQGNHFDLGLLEALYTFGMALVFVLLDGRRRPDGFYTGLFFALYGPVRFAMDALRTGDARYLGWTPGQYLSVVATVLGLAVLAACLRRPSGPSPGEAV